MRPAVGVLAGLAIWCLAYPFGLWVPAEESPANRESRARTSAQPAHTQCCCQSPAELAAVIDALVAQKWKEEEVQPAALAEDAEFLRRVYLDLVGRIPSVAEARAFLDHRAANKRAELVRQLLQSHAFLNHWSAILAETWLSGSDNAFLLGSWRAMVQSWLRDHLRRGSGYDKIVRELLTAHTTQQPVAAQPAALLQVQATPTAFYQAYGFNPRNLAASVSRQFLGIQLDCAECHNHPFARWKRQQFWELAAFFSGFERRVNGRVFYSAAENPQQRSLVIPDTNVTATARFLDGTEPDWNTAEFTRAALADWLVSPKNPYFAKAAANRVWYQLMGYGIVDPPDDMHEENPPSHPELLETLAHSFAGADFDLRFLLEAICLSRPYQLSSERSSSGSEAQPRLFARRVVRRLTAAQLWDSLVEAAYWHPSESRVGAAPNPLMQRSPNPLTQRRAAFLEKFRDSASRPVEAETSVLQVLALMHGEAAGSAVRLETSPMLQMVTSYPMWNEEQRLEVLFLAALARRPQPHEQQRFLRHIEQSANKTSAWADVFWVLLNSPEFISNH
ncbi:hypothetical protein HRbin36_00920 [bacterium HR36]|nr:hypothetical protein HRbin36_00920 [bacterium HR36]